MSLTAHIVSHTHWDREWYLPFQEFRLKLVDLIDDLLDILAENTDYRFFTLDGQAIILEDYLAVRPEREDELRLHVLAGRLLIGPWYILPDEFLVSGEATIRNLMLGQRVCRRFGPMMKVGYVPDPFGHISQLPQILAGFGIDTAVFRRGLADEPALLRWAAADGTQVFVVYLRDGYDNAASLPSDPDEFSAAIRDRVDSLAPHTESPYVLLMNGTDHMPPMRELPTLIAYANRQLDGIQLIHSTLPQFIATVRHGLGLDPSAVEGAGQRPEPDEGLKVGGSYPPPSTVPIVQGELRSPRRHHLLPGVLSTRMWIKQRNHALETLLERWAEPFSAWAWMLGGPDRGAQVWQAWRYLVENHPHDSICGCSVDQVHREMVARFDWAEQIAKAVTAESLATIAGKVNTTAFDAGIPIVVFNPAAGPRTDIVTVEMPLPAGNGPWTVVDEHGRPLPTEVPEKHVQFVAADVPGHGYRTFALKKMGTKRNSGELRGTNRRGTQGNLEELRGTKTVGPAGKTTLENEFFKVQVDATDGTLTVVDKQTGAVFRGLNRFVDGGDRGDEYNYCPPAEHLVVDTPAQPPRISHTGGPARQSVRIAMTYRLPAALTEDRQARSQELVEVPITTTVSLSPGVPRIDVQTTVDNRARDHRLGVQFPTPVQTDHNAAESQFDVVERSIDLPQDTSDWVEQPVGTHPQSIFVDVTDGDVGLMVANRGLPEYEVIERPSGSTIAITLLRCVGWLSRDDFPCREGHAGPFLATPEAQCLGKNTFEYSLIPHAGDWQTAFAQAHAFNAPFQAVTTGVSTGPLPSTSTLLEVEPASFVVTAVKTAEAGDGVIVRGYNIGTEPVEAHVRLNGPARSVFRVNLAEEPIESLESDAGGWVRVPVRSREIITLKFHTPEVTCQSLGRAGVLRPYGWHSRTTAPS
ncbi:MAG: alpha-mannosidase [Anaerolineae bacterium]